MSATSNFINYLMNKTFSLISLTLLIFMGGCDNNKKDISPKTHGADKNNIVVPASKTRTIIFFGNSITAGYGVDPSEAFPALIQNKIDSLKLNYKVINAGVSGETSAGGNGRINWILRQPVDIFVLELGGNDGLRGIPLTETKKICRLLSIK